MHNLIILHQEFQLPTRRKRKHRTEQMAMAIRLINDLVMLPRLSMLFRLNTSWTVLLNSRWYIALWRRLHGRNCTNYTSFSAAPASLRSSMTQTLALYLYQSKFITSATTLIAHIATADKFIEVASLVTFNEYFASTELWKTSAVQRLSRIAVTSLAATALSMSSHSRLKRWY